MVTLRMVYTKEKYMKFLGHLELMKLFERVFRYNKLPLKYSEGFNPIPKMTFASPLSVGYSSKSEVMEVVLENEVDVEKIKALNFPDGIKITDAVYVESKKSLMASLTHASYIIKVEFKQNITQLPIAEWVDKFMEETEVTFEKKAKNGKFRALNIIPFILAFKCVYQGENDLILSATVQSGSQGSLNPETLIKTMLNHYALPHEVIGIEIERNQLYFEREGTLKPLFELRD